MMKLKIYTSRLSTFLVMMCMALGAFPYDFVLDNIYYNIQDDGTLCVTYKSNSFGGYSGNVVIPDSVTMFGGVRRAAVTAVGNEAFNHCDGVLTITLPATVQSIGNYAFAGCIRLKSVNIPSGIETLSNGLFNDCRSLTTIELPSTVKTIGNRCFHGSGLTTIDLPASVTRIEDEAFRDCDKLVDVVIPESVDYLGQGAFYWCDGLETVKLSSRLIAILPST
ncbi:MAG: leucine-rich repeat domain-containing protein, partial [Muribaculaceae bacterium]|nr:leucine-rich repeat domain-containing protein [Muribaculaceae bacterium]